MAVQGTTDDASSKSGHQAPGADIPERVMQAPGPKTPGSGPDLWGMLGILGSAQMLGPDIEKYIETLTDFFARDTGSSTLGKISSRRLSAPQGAHAFFSGDAAIVLIFTALLSRDLQNFVPLSDATNRANIAFREEFGALPPQGTGPRLLNVVMVNPEDYPLATQMSHNILSALAGATSSSFVDRNISALVDSEYRVDPDLHATRAFIASQSPHAVMPRIDIGFVISARQPRRGGNFNVQPAQDDEFIPIAAVGAYTEIQVGQSHSVTGTRYVPLVHITCIASTVPLSGIISLCLAVAADQFISGRRWLQQFTSFTKVKPNLGQLSNDPLDPKKLWFAADNSQLDSWMNNNMLPAAILAIDVCEGRWRIPQLAQYGSPEGSGRVYAEMERFFAGRVVFDKQRPAFTVKNQSFIGTFGDESGRLTDSREIDLLNLIARHGAQDEETRKCLLNYPDDASIRARIVSEKTGSSFRSLWRTPISVLDGALLGTLAHSVLNVLNIKSSQRMDRMSTNDWEAQAAFYATQNFTVTRSHTGSGTYGAIGNYQV